MTIIKKKRSKLTFERGAVNPRLVHSILELIVVPIRDPVFLVPIIRDSDIPRWLLSPIAPALSIFKTFPIELIRIYVRQHESTC